VLLVAGAGLWTIKSWGWKLSIGINIAGIITSIAVLALGSVGAVPPLIISVIIVYYLSRKSVRDLFRSGSMQSTKVPQLSNSTRKEDRNATVDPSRGTTESISL